MTMPIVAAGVDLDRLLQLRLVVARVGEMDLARWWNAEGVLGPRGSTMFRLGLPKTHWFAQARVVFTIARNRCREVYPRPNSVTLWDLPGDVEEAFDDAWSGWVQSASARESFFGELSKLAKPDLLDVLEQFELLPAEIRTTVTGLKRSAEKRAVQIPGDSALNDDLVTLLAAGFSRGEVGQLAVPFFAKGA